MMWIEILSRHHDVLSRQRIDHDGDTIRIGRGYDNDVIVDDPYVAAYHAMLKRDAQGNWTAFDQGTRNGMMVGKNGRRCAEVRLHDGTDIRIGRTWFRLRSAHAPVPPERELSRFQHHAWRLAFLIALVVTLMEVAGIWLDSVGEYKTSQYMSAILAAVTVVLVWTSVWAINSRIFTAQGHFDQHLLIALSGLLALSVLDALLAVGAYAVSLPALVQYYFVPVWLVVSATIFVHLRAIGPARRRLKAAGVILLAVVAIGAQGTISHEARNDSGQPVFLQQLKPSAMRLVPARTPSAFFTDAGKLKVELDRARLEEKPDGAGMADDVHE